MRILNVIRNFLPPTQTFIFDHLLALESCDGVESSVLYYGERSALADKYHGIAVSADEMVGECLSKKDRLILQLLRKRSRKYEIRNAFQKYLELNQIDVIHCHFAWGAWQLLQPTYSDLKRKPGLVISVHGTDILKGLKEAKNREALCALSFMPRVRIVATSGYLEKILIQNGVCPDAIAIVANTVNPIFESMRDRHLAREKSSFRVVHNGRFVACKGHRYLLEAFAAFVEITGADATLTLIGDGELRQPLEEMTRALGIADRVVFVGYCPHDSVADILCKSDVYVHPSVLDLETGQEEGFGIAILEAMAVGLPVIASRTGGVPNAVGATSSFVRLVEPATVSDITAELIDIYHSGIYQQDNYPLVEARLAEVSAGHHLRSYLSIYRDVMTR